MGGMTELAPSLVELARRFGIATGYADWTGRQVLVPEMTLVAVLASFGVAAGTEQDRNAALTAHSRAYWARHTAGARSSRVPVRRRGSGCT